MPPVKKNVVSLETKLKIINEAETTSYAALGEKYGLSKNTINSIVRRKQQLLLNVESGQFSSDKGIL